HIQVDSADTTFAGTALARGGAAGGDGGLIETSGTQVNFTGAHIDTTAAAGKTGEWLVDPTDLTIDTSNNATLSADLATTSVVLQTTSSTASGIVGVQTTTGSTKGDINIDAPVSWSSSSTLTLEAYHSIYINAPVTISGSGVNAGRLTMTTNAATTDGDLFFGGGGNVQFTGSNVANLGGHASLNGTSFTLETSVANLITAINANPAGNYALATSVTASGTLNGDQVAAPGNFNSTFVGTPFTGVLEGLGNTITGLTIHDTTATGTTGAIPEVFVGLIGYLAAPGVVRDIGISGANVSSLSTADSVGALVGYNAGGSIINAWSSGTVSGQTAGGLVGTNGDGLGSIGGLVSGSRSSASVTIVSATGDGNPAGGGLVGENGDNATPALVTRSYATGQVSDGGVAGAVGGLVGFNGLSGNSGLISQSYATGVVTATGNQSVAGGLVGDNNDTIIDSYASGTVNSGANIFGAGGLVGQNDFSIVNAYSSGVVSGAGTRGGAIGFDDSTTNGAVVSHVYYDSTVNSIAGIGTSTGATATGETTITLKGSTLPSGFNTAINVTTGQSFGETTSATAWGAFSGFYPFLNFQYPHGAIEVSGTVFNGYDTSLAGTGLTVALASFGTIQSTALTNASGVYALLADGGQQSEVLLSGDAFHANTYLGAPTSATTANLYSGYLRLPAASTSLSSTLAGVSLAVGNNTGSDFLYTSAGGLAANASVDIITGGAFVLDTALNAGTGTVSISAGGAVTQTAALDASKLDLLGSGASYSLTAIGNSIGTLAANTGGLTLTDGSALTVGAVNATTGVTSTGAVSLSASGNLSLASGGVTAGANSNVTLAATGDFLNSVGASAVQVSGTGRWLIYSAVPGADSFGALNSNNTAVWDTASGGSVSASGNRYVFAFQPTLTFTSTSDSKTYGADANTQIQSDLLVSGLQTGVANAYLGDAFSGTPTLSSAGASTSATVLGGPYPITVTQGSVVFPSGYASSLVSPGLLTINPATVSWSVANSSSTYGTLAMLGAVTLTGVLGSDQPNIDATTGAFTLGGTSVTLGARTAAGNYLAEVIGLTGSAASNYILATSGNSDGALTINPLALTVGLANTVSKTYDGTTAATLAANNYTLSGVIAGDTVNLNDPTSGTYDTKDAGTGKTVTVNGLSLVGAEAGDYTISATTSGAVGVINPLALTASLVGNVTKTYDGNTDAALAGANYTLSAPIGSDVVSLVPVTAGTYDTKDAGTGKTVSVSGLTLTGADAEDYTVVNSLSGAVGVINPLALTASLVGNVTKTYDGNTDAALTGANYTLSASIGSDVVSLAPVTAGTYDTKDAGTGKTVSVSGLTLTGADAGDYTVASSLSGAIGVINPLALTATLNGPVSKTYDGTTAATLDAGAYTLNNVISGDSVGLGAPTSGTYDTKDVGTGKTVTFIGLSVIGADAGDYSFSGNLSGAVGVISPLALTASLTGTVSKTYDGTTAATLTSANYTLSGVIGGDSVGLNSPTAGTYDTKDAGTGKTVTATGLALTGADDGDYSITGTASGAVGTINPLALTAALTGTATKTYDGTTTAALSSANYTLSGVIGGDSVGLNNPASGTYDTKDVGTGKTVTANGVGLVGADAGDYTVANSLSAAIGTITQLALTATLNGPVTKTYDGTTAATLAAGAYTLNGVIGGDSVGLGAPTSGTYDTKDVGTGKTVTFTGLALTGADAGDYSYSGNLSGAVGVINALALTASLTGPVSKVYDGTTTASLTSGNYVLSGIVSGDSVGLNDPAFGTYDTKDAGSGKLVTVGGLALTGADAGDYTVAASTSGNVGVVTPLALTASLTGTTSRTYNGTTTASLGSGNYVLAGAVSGDSVALNDPAFGLYDTKDVGVAKTVTASGLALTGADAGDYSIANSVSGAIGTITPLALTARLTGSVTKTYDGTTGATLGSNNYILAGLVSGDAVALNDPTAGAYDTKDVGTGKTVTVGGLALSGAQAGDYSITSSVSGAIGTITPLALIARLTGSVTKIYDGTTLATLTSGDYVLAGAVSGDSVALNDPTAGTYDTKDVGTGKTVTVTGLALTGAQAGDYSIAGTVAGPVGTITPLALMATAAANSKVYDATTTDTGSAILGAGVVAGDQVSLTSGTFTFSDPNAGQGKTVTVSGLVLTGADARDYSLSAPSSTTADITARPITIAANDVTKLDGQADPPLTFSIPSGSLAGNDQVSGALARASGETLGAYDINQGSLALSANYLLTFVDGLFTIAPPTPGNIAFAPANAQGSNASNGPSSFTTAGPGPGTEAGSASTAAGSPGLAPSAFGARQQDDNSGSPYPDNRRFSDNIRFKIGTNP
ncbi:MAG: YDG domain-containing protein, partial [Caulobacteraceae bacterium]